MAKPGIICRIRISINRYDLAGVIYMILKNLQINRPLAFIDIETTGLNPNADRIVELTVLKIYPNGDEDLRSKRTNPEIPIPSSATAIHGITDENVANEPTFKQYAKNLLEFLNDCDLAGFGIMKLDLPLLEAEFKRAGLEFNRKGRSIIDALTIYHQLEPRNLEAAYKQYCGKVLGNAHSSHADVKAALEVLEGQLNAHPELPKEVNELHTLCNPDESNWVDSSGKLLWRDGEVTINFGKHKGKTIKELKQLEPDFLIWMTKAEFPHDVKEIISKALSGIFPIR